VLKPKAYFPRLFFYSSTEGASAAPVGLGFTPIGAAFIFFAKQKK
jgi:hypothetical protein